MRKTMDDLQKKLDEATYADWSGGAPAVEPAFAQSVVDEVLRLRSLARYEVIGRERLIEDVCYIVDTEGQLGTIESIKASIRKLKAAYADGVPQAWADVIAERQRQIEKHGFNHQQDDGYVFDELPRAARAYIMVSNTHEDPPPSWPWARSFWKPRTRRRNLVKAVALLIAEIERIDRK
jgi:virulence-associated protein VapD